MNRRITAAAVTGLVAGLLLLASWRTPDALSQSPADSAVAGARAADVEVRQTLVTVTPIAAAIAPRTRDVTVTPRTTALASTRRRGADAPQGLVARAKQAFFGNGRHRPEPFPRAKNH